MAYVCNEPNKISMRKIAIAALFVLAASTGTRSQTLVTRTVEKVSSGIASFYHSKFEGRKTATGEVFDNNKYTAASNTHKLGSYVKVTNTKNGEVVYVKVNDRMAASNHRVLDLTSKAASDLRFRNSGTTNVKVEAVSDDEGRSRVLAQVEGERTPVVNKL